MFKNYNLLMINDKLSTIIEFNKLQNSIIVDC